MSRPEEEPLGKGKVVVPEMRDIDAEDTPQKMTLTDMDVEARRNAGPRRQESVIQRLKSVKQESKSPAQTVQNSIALICATFLCTALHAMIQLAIAIISITIGAKYLDHCPAERYIPIYLVVIGATTLVSFLMTCIWNYYQARQKQKERRGEPLQPPSGCCKCLILLRSILVTLIALFSIAWFIAGSVWVYGLHGKYSSHQGDPNYCNSVVYVYAFVLLTIAWCTLGLVIFVLVCCCFCACVTS